VPETNQESLAEDTHGTDEADAPLIELEVDFPEFPTINDVSEDTLENLNNLTQSLPKLPTITMDLLPVLAQPGSGAKEVAKVIERDQSTAARMLRWVNSSFYGLEGKVNSLQRAITILGMDTVRSVVLEDSFSRDQNLKGIPGLELETIWRHAAATSIAAKYIARKVRGVEPDVAATAGLLHDIGFLLMLMMEAQNLELAMKEAIESDRPMLECEYDLLGFNHQIWGETFIRAWRLPDVIADAIGKHHSPLKEPFNPLAAVLWLCNYLVTHVGFPCPNDIITTPTDEQIALVMGKIGLTPPMEHHVTESLVREMISVAQLWSIKTGAETDEVAV
jgi:putative nucleotidyltransferase with HDIG domain